MNQTAIRPPTDNTWTIAGAMLPWKGGDNPEQWERDLKALASVGFTSVDITDSWVKPGAMTQGELRELDACISSAGLSVAAVSAIRCSVIDPDDGEANLAYSHATLEAAAALGADVVSVGLHRPLTPRQQEQLWFWTVPGPVDDRDQETFTAAASRLRELAVHADGLGIELSLELYEDTLLGDSVSACHLLELIGHTNVGLNPDIGNLVRQQRPIENLTQMLENVLPLTNYWHVKNYLRMENPQTGAVLTTPSSMRAGVIDYRSAFALARHLGFSGALCIEQYGGDMVGIMQENLDYCRELVERTSTS